MIFVRNVENLIRILAYLWVATEALFLAQLYWYGYIRYKKTKVIMALHRVFLFIGLFFLFLSFLPALELIDDTLYHRISDFLLIVILPLGLALQTFRKESITDQEQVPPIHKIIKKGGDKTL